MSHKEQLNIDSIRRIENIKDKYKIYKYILLTESTLKECENEAKIEFDINNSKKGKVRDIYYLTSERLALSASDRISAFDRNLTTIPYKGIVLHKISEWWFNKTKHIVPNHVIESYNNRTMIVNKCKVIPIEFVMRSYLTGTTSTSIWKNYEKGIRLYCGHLLPDNMVKNQKLCDVLLTPTTKGKSDELISEREIIDNCILTPKQWSTCKKYSHDLFKFGQKIANENGLILVDTKYEFGINNFGDIILIDELHTPDSSRYWVKHNYIDKMSSNEEPESIDKEIVRKWVVKNCGNPYNLNNKIEIPNDLRLELSSKYLQLYELITGDELDSSKMNRINLK